MDSILYILTIVLVFASQSILQGNYQKYRKMQTSRQMTGSEVARMILDNNGLSDVQVIPSNRGTLSDFYDPTNRNVYLSSDIYYNSSIASVSVAAHEVGHALQHAQNYGLIALRNKLLPATQIASQLGWVSIFIGLFSNIQVLFYIGIISLIVILIFQLVTLPIELNASSRAIAQLSYNAIIQEDEIPSCKKMLKSAAFTYVAALISSLIQIFRAILIKNNRNRD